MTICERIFGLLDEKRISQKEFADALGVNSRNISSWKKRGSDPPACLICRISEILQVPVVWLLSGEDEEKAAFVNNGSFAGNLGPNTGHVVVINGAEHLLSEECAEMVRIYEDLPVRGKAMLLSSAFEISDACRKEDPGCGD